MVPHSQGRPGPQGLVAAPGCLAAGAALAGAVGSLPVIPTTTFLVAFIGGLDPGRFSVEHPDLLK